ncbi:hypothetical protein GCM10010435_68610 [Winogradskya consettensis]
MNLRGERAAIRELGPIREPLWLRTPGRCPVTGIRSRRQQRCTCAPAGPPGSARSVEAPGGVPIISVPACPRSPRRSTLPAVAAEINDRQAGSAGRSKTHEPVRAGR